MSLIVVRVNKFFIDWVSVKVLLDMSRLEDWVEFWSLASCEGALGRACVVRL